MVEQLLARVPELCRYLVVSAQIEHLLELTKRPHVTVQVVPYQFSG